MSKFKTGDRVLFTPPGGLASVTEPTVGTVVLEAGYPYNYTLEIDGVGMYAAYEDELSHVIPEGYISIDEVKQKIETLQRFMLDLFGDDSDGVNMPIRALEHLREDVTGEFRGILGPQYEAKYGRKW